MGFCSTVKWLTPFPCRAETQSDSGLAFSALCAHSRLHVNSPSLFEDHAFGRELERARIRHGLMANRERDDGVVLVFARVDAVPTAGAQLVRAASAGLRCRRVDLIGLRLRDERHDAA